METIFQKMKKIEGRIAKKKKTLEEAYQKMNLLMSFIQRNQIIFK